MFDLKWFAHGLNMYNLAKGPAPEEVFEPDNLPQQIAEAGGQRRYANAAYAAEEEAIRETMEEKKQRRRVVAVAGMIAADRTALFRTITYIEKRLRDGTDRSVVFQEAARVREQEFDRIVNDPGMTDRYRAAVEDMPADIKEARRIFITNGPLLDPSRPVPNRPR